MKRYLLGLVFVLSFAASPAAAAPINCATNAPACDAIELGPGPWVKYVDNTGRYMDLTNPTYIDMSITATNGTYHNQGLGSLASGLVKVLSAALSNFNTFASAEVHSKDVFTVTGPNPGSIVNITASFTADGTATLVNTPNGGGLGVGGSASAILCGPFGGYNCGGDHFNYTGAPQTFVPYTGPVYSNANPSQPFLQHQVTFGVTVGQPFSVEYWLVLQAYNGSTMDMYNTGTLGFAVPGGYSITSLGGFSSPLPPPPPPPGVVPEPSTWTLFALGSALLARGIYRRKRR
jgi:hypothetical protein